MTNFGKDLLSRGIKKFGLKWDYNPTILPSFYKLTDKGEVLGTPSENAQASHMLIKSDNLTALSAIYEESRGSIDFCYIDPPYNTGNSSKTGFTYKDSFKNKEDQERHSTWLTFMYERLVITKELLTESGVIAISIDDREIHYLRLICDEIFGEQNFIAQIIVDGGNPKNNATFISTTHEYLLVYSKNVAKLKKNGTKWRKKREGLDILVDKYQELSKTFGNNYNAISSALKEFVKDAPLTKRLKVFTNCDSRGLYTYADLSAPGKSGARYDVLHPITGKPCQVPSRGWGLTEEKMQDLIKNDMVLFGANEKFQPMKKLYLRIEEADQVERSIIDFPSRTPTHLLEKMLNRRNSFNNPKNMDLMMHIIGLMCPPGGKVLDYFAGSGTTGHAVIELNNSLPQEEKRKFILITNNENNIYEDVTLPRLKAALTGQWLDGSKHAPSLDSMITYSVEEYRY